MNNINVFLEEYLRVGSPVELLWLSSVIKNIIKTIVLVLVVVVVGILVVVVV
jgi:hypothetical protein